MLRRAPLGFVVAMLLVGAPASSAEAPASEDASAAQTQETTSFRELASQAMATVVKELGLSLASGSIREGWFTTAFVPLDPAMIPELTRRRRGEQSHGTWGAAEYRHFVSMEGSEAAIVRIKTEILGSPPPPVSSAKIPLRSNGTLERKLTMSFWKALAELEQRLPQKDSTSTWTPPTP